ncbi:MAG: SpoIIE family protein phosphatase [FCB group bacterium]|nr:SpoIIE family protein phosphatase [FCB group bacterium]
MQVSDFEHFRDVLLERRQNLTEWLNSASMAHTGDAEKVHRLLEQIKEALDRVKSATYGECKVCHEGVELHRLEVQPVKQICLCCISEEEQAELEEDLYLASKIHRALLPQTTPKIEGFEVEVRSLAASNIGGDYYDFLPDTDSQTFRVIIADAMGHGLPAGLLMSNLQGAMRILSSDINEPGPLIARLNQWLCRNVPVTKFVSLVCLDIEKTSAKETRVTYTNAGHCQPVLIRKDGSVERLEVTGGVLGVDEEFTYDEQRVSLFSGDILVLYTDGIIEAENAQGELYGEDRLVEFIRAQQKDSFQNVVDGLLNSVFEFSGTSQAADDLTVLMLHKK